MIAQDQAGGLINGRSIKRNTGRRSSVEVWWRMYLHHFDLYYCLLGARICELLTTDQADLKNRIYTDRSVQILFLKIRLICGYQVTTSSSASCHTGKFGRIAQRYR